MKPRLYAHRGAAAELPENTLPSFRRALEHGADALEMDVHMTRDGHIVVSHDDSGRRMCGVPVCYRETSIDEVRQWDAGYGFVGDDEARPFAGKEFRVPTLDEVLYEFRDVVINIDIKQPEPPMVAPVLDLIGRHRVEHRVILASFHLRTMMRIRARGYSGATAMPMAELIALRFLPRSAFLALPMTGEAVQIPPRPGGVDLSAPPFLDKCRDLGLRVDYWTINDPAEALRLLQCGADGIMTDDPAAIAPAFHEFLGS